MFDLTNRVVMITGASGNLGNAASLAFRSAGARLVLVDRTKNLLHDAFPQLIGDPDCLMNVCADITNLDNVKESVAESINHFGRMDVFVNTVGGFRAGTALHETPRSTWDFMMNLNALTVFNTHQAITPYMLKQGSGKIIHVAARPGLQGRANMAAYSASKAAVIRLVWRKP